MGKITDQYSLKIGETVYYISHGEIHADKVLDVLPQNIVLGTENEKFLADVNKLFLSEEEARAYMIHKETKRHLAQIEYILELEVEVNS